MRDQRDALQKQIELSEKEVVRLLAQVAKLGRRVEMLDDDLMMKDGQLSILRGLLDRTSNSADQL
jgi:hypothetical protein